MRESAVTNVVFLFLSVSYLSFGVSGGMCYVILAFLGYIFLERTTKILLGLKLGCTTAEWPASVT